MKNCFFPKERPARTPPPTFLFLPIHFSNSPGIMAIPTLRYAGEPSKPVHPRTIGCRFTIPVRSFRGAQSRRKRTARRWPYIGVGPANCQPKMTDSTGPAASIYPCIACTFGPPGKRRLNSRRAALKPYCWVVLGALSRDGIAAGASSRRLSGQLTSVQARH